MTQVAVVGAGLIGRAWTIVFARAGFDVRLWDPERAAVDSALRFVADRLPELHEAGLLSEPPVTVLGAGPPGASPGRGGTRGRARAGERTRAGGRQAHAVG